MPVDKYYLSVKMILRLRRATCTVISPLAAHQSLMAFHQPTLLTHLSHQRVVFIQAMEAQWEIIP
jgi:hypothetical protein